ncbi:MAG: DUF502 domain-containing protein [Betaproteobacteria bacterium]|nr:DUF502 domain-containing protein [Betaproteobacteria bacterium]
MKAIFTQSAKQISRIFLRGLVVVLPIAITLALIYWLAVSAENLLGGIVRLLIPDKYYSTGLGVLLGIGLVFAAGLTVNVWFTRELLGRAEAVMERIPIVKSVYGGIRDLARFFSDGRSKQGFHKVVMVTLTDEIRLIGFLTRENFTDLPPQLAASDDTVAVYLPMSYQIGGYTVYVPRSRVEPIDMTNEDAMRFTLTAGMSSAKTVDPNAAQTPTEPPPRAP